MWLIVEYSIFRVNQLFDLISLYLLLPPMRDQYSTHLCIIILVTFLTCVCALLYDSSCYPFLDVRSFIFHYFHLVFTERYFHFPQMDSLLFLSILSLFHFVFVVFVELNTESRSLGTNGFLIFHTIIYLSFYSYVFNVRFILFIFVIRRLNSIFGRSFVWFGLFLPRTYTGCIQFLGCLLQRFPKFLADVYTTENSIYIASFTVSNFFIIFISPYYTVHDISYFYN